MIKAVEIKTLSELEKLHRIRYRTFVLEKRVLLLIYIKMAYYIDHIGFTKIFLMSVP